LACDVYDFLFKGFSQPLIGTFSIPIGEIKFKVESKRNEFVKKAKALLRDLK